ncbi:zf-HC2 domain-containing protein [Serpentinicella alkaliphila]|uniref:Zinc finger protein n=1 Tax=Serpentinicella alkaliphila TaxID=1734049 RepID=A0A4R2TB51_9FIRM|nr:zf-HC2 domain-containing protein [Serpentinicella alkaliphila]QUH25735.1 zf-HC2 domain-containing protein [Serpentinicella alkaliphila]TCP99016.1 hypothetical protein EDD79_103818 [Serpentinicella alkaliphila]
MNQHKSNISCGICQDLIPLVLDNVASEDSQRIVTAHVECCKDCEILYNSVKGPDSNLQDDSKIIKSIKRKIYFSCIALLVIGTMIGVYLSNSMGMFYNIILMPMIGAIAYYILGKRWYIVSVGVFITSYIWLFVGFVIEYRKLAIEIFYYPIYLTAIYTALTVIGVFVSKLLYFAFKKEGVKHVK